MVQDPDEAEHPAMLPIALANVPGARCLPLTETVPMLARPATGRVGGQATVRLGAGAVIASDRSTS